MPTFNDPAADAAESQHALRGLAHATRIIDDPTQLYAVLGSLSAAASSLEQSLHQLAEIHDEPASRRTWLAGDQRESRATSYQVTWELHRAGEVMRQVAASLSRAHEMEAQIAYDQRDTPLQQAPPRSTPGSGLSL